MRRIILLTLLLTACPKDDAKTPQNPRENPEPPTVSLTPHWGGVEKSTNGCPEDFDYFPSGGMRNMWCHLKTLMSFSELAKASPVPIFKSGPHTNTTLNLNHEREFGHYNPRFATWVADAIIPPASAVAATRRTYQKHFHRLASIYMEAYVFLQRNPDYLKQARLEYEAYLGGKRGDVAPHHRHEEPEDAYNLYSPAVAFWVRRTIDGSASEFARGLETLIGRYEPEFLAEIKAKKFAIKKIDPPDEPPLPSPTNITEAINLAWASLPGRKSSCKHVFDYQPGGLRVAFCRVIAAVTYSAVVKASGVKPFLSGPHDDSKLNFDATTFGRYNPKFVQWLSNNAIPAATQPAFRQKTQDAYDEKLRVAARAFWYARLFLANHPGAAQIRESYTAFVSNGGKGEDPRWRLWNHFEAWPSYEAQTIAGSGVAFWIRREIDGTDKLFAEGLRKLLGTYDAAYLSNSETIPWAKFSASKSSWPEN